MEFFAGDFRELGLRVMNIVNIDALDIQVSPAAVELIEDIARRHAVAARDHTGEALNTFF